MVGGSSTADRYHPADDATADIISDLVDDIVYPIGVRVPTADLLKHAMRSVWDIAHTEGFEAGEEAGYEKGEEAGYNNAQADIQHETGGDRQGLDIIARFVGQMVNTEEGRQVLRCLSAWEESIIRRFAQ